MLEYLNEGREWNESDEFERDERCAREYDEIERMASAGEVMPWDMHRGDEIESAASGLSDSASDGVESTLIRCSDVADLLRIVVSIQAGCDPIELGTIRVVFAHRGDDGIVKVVAPDGRIRVEFHIRDGHFGYSEE